MSTPKKDSNPTENEKGTVLNESSKENIVSDNQNVKEAFKAPFTPDMLNKYDMKYDSNGKELFKAREEVFKDLESILIKIKTDPVVPPPSTQTASIQQTTES